MGPAGPHGAALRTTVTVGTPDARARGRSIGARAGVGPAGAGTVGAVGALPVGLAGRLANAASPVAVVAAVDALAVGGLVVAVASASPGLGLLEGRGQDAAAV